MWYKLLERNQFLESIYDEIPDLQNVLISSIYNENQGSKISLFLELSTFPLKPPDEWMKEGKDTIIVGLSFYGIRDFSMHKGTGPMKVNISIEKKLSGDILVLIRGAHNTEFSAQVGTIQSIRAYQSILE